MNYLITGGAGFIGSTMIKYLINNTNNYVLNIDKLTYASNIDSLKEVSNNPRYKFFHSDICNQTKLNIIVNQFKPDIVMHFAAESHVDNSIANPAIFIQTNIVGTYKLLECILSYWQRLDNQHKQFFRFHHISTDEVYGDMENTKEFSTEKSPYMPSSPYSASKASADHLVRAWHRTYGLPIVISNCTNNFGPYQYPEKLIPLSIYNAIHNKPIKIFGNGKQMRDWLYVEDHVRALYLVATNGQVGETYNICGYNIYKNIEVVESICDILAQFRPANYNKLITFIDDRPGHDVKYALDRTKIEFELGWKPIESFHSALTKTISWYLNFLNNK